MKKIMIFLTYGNINLFKKTKLKHVQIIKNQCFDIILQVFGKKISTYSITQSPLKSMYKNPKIKNFLKVKMYAQKPPAGLRSTCGAKFLNFYVFLFFCFFLISQKLSASDKQLLLRKKLFSKQCKYIINTSYHTWNIIFHTASTSKHMVNFILCW